MSRRGLLRGAALAVAGGGVAMLAEAGPAAAATGDPILAGETNAADTYTGLGAPIYSTAFFATSGAGATNAGGYTAAIVGDSQASSGVAGLSDAASGVYGGAGSPSGGGFAQAGVLGDSHDYPGVMGRSSAQPGVSGQSVDSPGVFGTSTNGTAVQGFSPNSHGVFGWSYGKGVGVYGESSTQDGVIGSTGVYGLSVAPAGPTFVAGVVGDSKSQYGVVGVSHSNAGLYGKGTRGAILTGTRAQAQLKPSTAPTHPAGGLCGDLFVDASGRLWFCTQTSSSAAAWTQIA